MNDVNGIQSEAIPPITPVTDEMTALLMFRGALPIAVAGALEKSGAPFITVGFTEAPPLFPTHYTFSLGKAGGLLRVLRARKVKRVCFFGALSRPKFWKLRFDLKGLKLFFRLAPALASGDDALMRAIIAFFEREGFHVPDAAEIAPSLLCPSGCLTERAPSRAHLQSAAIGVNYLNRTAETDTGQACAVAGNIIAAVEAAEGTAEMIERAGRLSGSRLRAAPAPILVKAPKMNQDMRADLPTVGIRTIEQLKAAGFDGAFIEAEKTFLVTPAETVKAADAAGLFLYGFQAGDLIPAE